MTDVPLIDQLAIAAVLSINPDHKPGVALNLERLLDQARLVMAVELTEAAEPAPIFTP